MQRTNDIDVKIEEGRFLLSVFREQKFVEFEGWLTICFAVGNTEEVWRDPGLLSWTAQPKKVYEEKAVHHCCKQATHHPQT